MDFVFDYISVNAFWTILLIAHGLLAVATLGALGPALAAAGRGGRARACGPGRQ